MTAQVSATPRQSYHHGDLRQALLAAGIELAGEGGPDAVVLREATRRVGVSPNAAYRHFADREALLAEVCNACQSKIAAAMDAAYDAISPGEPAEMALERLRSVGRSYVGFAQDNPGLFLTAISASPDLENINLASRAGPSGRTPYGLLTAALDELVDAGLMPASRRPQAEFLAWSSVHGLAMLLIEGPLRALPRPQADGVTERVVGMVEAAFTAD